MREEKLFRAIGEIDGDLVKEAANYEHKKTAWWKYGTLVAGLLLVVAAGKFSDLFAIPDTNIPDGIVAEGPETIPSTEDVAESAEGSVGELVQNETGDNAAEEVESSQFAKRDVLDFTMTFGDMGYEGMMAYEMLDFGHPWKETDEITTLPVIENNSIYNMQNIHDPHPLYGEEYDPLLEWLAEAAEFFGMVQIESTIKEDRVFVENEEISIEVNGNMEMTIEFKNGISLPEEFDLSNQATREETYAVAEYLVEQYGELLGMKEPQISISDGDYTFFAERLHNEIIVYEKGNDARETLLNYHFNRAEFTAWEDEGLWYIRICRTAMEPILGEYEIITAEEAIKLLDEGQFDTTYHESEFPGIEYVRDVELVYHMSFADDYKPYYRFWVEVPAEKLENGLNTYVAYYVPAVEIAYMDITFN